MKTADGIMSNGGWPFANRRILVRGAAILLVGTAAASLPALGLHAPDWSVLAAQSPLVQAHVGAAVAALLIGGGLMLGVKGRRLHRVFGWACAALVMIAAFSSMFIRSVNGDALSLIHGLSAWTMLTLPLAVLAARRRNVQRHRKMMHSLFYGGLVLAGLFAFVPGRTMHNVFFG